jgi:hypothetical protein
MIQRTLAMNSRTMLSACAAFRHGLFSALILIALAAVAAPVAAQGSECGWLETDTLNQGFPQYAPWQVMTGGQIGSCRFRSRSDRAPNLFSANQMVHDSDQVAADFVANLRSEMAASYDIVDAPALGEQGFYYLPSDRSGAAAGRTVGYAGHRGRVTALGNLVLQETVSLQARETGQELILAALSVADDDSALAAASDCRWFNESILSRLLPNGAVTQNVMGENSCFATDSANAVLSVSVHPASPAMLNRGPGDCTIETLAEMGDHAQLGYACTGGRPRAVVKLVVGEMVVTYNLIPQQEPSPEQRQALVELAHWAQRSNSGN